MKRRRRQFSERFKAKVAVEAIKGIKTLAELSTIYKIHPNQISAWKKQLLSNAPELFSSGKKRPPKSEEQLTAPLYEEIGRLKMDIKWLEKKL
uniref:Transposase n=1 Tax=Candidatus Kentrum eta TaxID=2126337 RepID=A0A450UYQ4_9GAMM|nr:MAG: Transposase [Candidatus Kentron sp. H]